MRKSFKVALSVFIFLGIIAFVGFYMGTHNIPVLDPKGIVAEKQKDLLIDASLLMLIVVVPVILMTLIFAWKYRESNKDAKYTPNWDHSTIAELFWWGVPFVIIIVLSIMTAVSTYELNPFKPLPSDKKPIKIQAVALQWKWLFIYPELGIATLNYVQFPEKTPLNFEITADAPMNSFWIPALGGQIYAMPAMRTKLHLMASEIGVYRGSSANLSGSGFAGMFFDAEAVTEREFNEWVARVKNSGSSLTWEAYEQLVVPSQYQAPELYVLKKKELFDAILMQYMP